VCRGRQARVQLITLGSLATAAPVHTYLTYIPLLYVLTWPAVGMKSLQHAAYPGWANVTRASEQDAAPTALRLCNWGNLNTTMHWQNSMATITAFLQTMAGLAAVGQLPELTQPTAE
jgi:hypothetical protein